jgi:putative addiction module CopG family antidote
MSDQDRQTVSLTSGDEAFIASQIEGGAFNSASEVVRAGLKLLEREAMKVEALRREIAKGDADIAAGRTWKPKPGEIAAEMTAALARRAKA